MLTVLCWAGHRIHKKLQILCDQRLAPLWCLDRRTNTASGWWMLPGKMRESHNGGGFPGWVGLMLILTRNSDSHGILFKLPIPAHYTLQICADIAKLAVVCWAVLPLCGCMEIHGHITSADAQGNEHRPYSRRWKWF